MKELLKCAQKYKDRMNLMDFALIKVCIFSMGVLIGVGVPKKCKKRVAISAGVAFAFTYAPIITKMLGIVAKDSEKAIRE